MIKAGILILLINMFQFSLFVNIHAEEHNIENSTISDDFALLADEALHYYKKYKSETGNKKLAQEYLKISYNNIRIMELTIENNLLDAEKENLDLKLISLETDRLKLQDDIRQNIKLLKDKKVQENISEELFYKSSLDKLEEALIKINLAQDVDSTVYGSGMMNEAMENYNLAKQSFDQGSNDESIKYSEKAIELATTAYHIAIEKNKRRDDLTSDLKNIFGFTTGNLNSTHILLSSKDLFLPASSTIRFDIYPSLDKIAKILGKYEEIQIEIESYDISKSGKLILSTEQSDKVKSYLVSKGAGNNIVVNNNRSIPGDSLTRGVNIILKY